MNYHVDKNKKQEHNQNIIQNINNDVVKIKNNIPNLYDSNIQNSLNISSLSKIDSSKNSIESYELKRVNSIELNINNENRNKNLEAKEDIKTGEEIKLHRNDYFTISVSPKKSFFTPSVSEKIKEQSKNNSYCNYISSIICCKRKEKSIYEVRTKALTDVINIHTFCRLIVLQKEYSNNLEHSSFGI